MARTGGPRPKPNAIKLVKGVTRKDRLNPSEPNARRGLPKAPKHLDQGAIEEWNEVVQDLYESGMLATTDRSILASYCVAWSRWVDAELAVQVARNLDRSGNFGLLVETSNGNLIQNPIVGSANKLLMSVAKLCEQLGMTPSARSRVHAIPSNEEDEDPANKYLDRAA